MPTKPPISSLEYFPAFMLAIALLLTSGSRVSKVDYLGSLEKRVIEEQNEARTDPKEYVKHLRRHRATFNGNIYKSRGGARVATTEGVKAVDEAIKFMEEAKRVSELRPSLALSLAAQDHVEDTGKKGLVGHTGSDGSQPSDRISRYGTWQVLTSENIAYGSHKARDIVMQLIIDDGVPDRGHRKNIFERKARYTGVNVGRHKRFGRMCVITYAGGIKDNGNARKMKRER